MEEKFRRCIHWERARYNRMSSDVNVIFGKRKKGRKNRRYAREIREEERDTTGGKISFS